MEALLQNYNTSNSTPTFFIHQLSFISVVLSSALRYRAMLRILCQICFQCTLSRGCRRHRSVSQNSLIRQWFIMKSMNKSIGINFKALNQTLWEWMKLDWMIRASKLKKKKLFTYGLYYKRRWRYLVVSLGFFLKSNTHSPVCEGKKCKVTVLQMNYRSTITLLASFLIYSVVN